MSKAETPETYKTMVLSTAHVTPLDCERLDALADCPLSGVTAHPYGYYIRVGLIDSKKVGSMSILFQAALEFTDSHDCHVLDLDRDAYTLACLAECEWP